MHLSSTKGQRASCQKYIKTHMIIDKNIEIQWTYYNYKFYLFCKKKVKFLRRELNKKKLKLCWRKDVLYLKLSIQNLFEIKG